MGRPKKQNGCVGGLTLFTFLIISGFAYFEWSFNWWQSILFGVVAQAMVAGAVNGAIAKAKKRNGTPYRERHPRKLNAPINASIVTHYLYEAANQLNDGFPLMRVSKDATPSSCPICSRWEGKLISLTNSPDFDGIAHSLRELLDSGIFHEDCIHRLEFVSIGEYPKDVFRKIRDRIGVPGAFGRMSVADIRALTAVSKTANKRTKTYLTHQF